MRKDNTILEAVYRDDLKTLGLIARKRGSLAEFVDDDGRNALMHAVLADPTSLAVVTLLLRHGVPVNERDTGQQWTALHFAAQAGKTDVMRVLLAAGADPNCKDMFGNTALWRAVFCAQDDRSPVEVLIAHGADPDIENASGVSPRKLAQTRGRRDIVALFNGATL